MRARALRRARDRRHDSEARATSLRIRAWGFASAEPLPYLSFGEGGRKVAATRWLHAAIIPMRCDVAFSPYLSPLVASRARHAGAREKENGRARPEAWRNRAPSTQRPGPRSAVPAPAPPVGAAAGRTRCRSSSRRRHFLISFGFKWTEHLEHLETARRRPEGVRGRAPSPMLNCKKKPEKQSRASCASIANVGSARGPAQQK